MLTTWFFMKVSRLLADGKFGKQVHMLGCYHVTYDRKIADITGYVHERCKNDNGLCTLWEFN